MKKPVVVNIRMDEPTRARFQRVAARTGVSASELARRVLTDFCLDVESGATVEFVDRVLMDRRAAEDRGSYETARKPKEDGE